MGCLVAIMPCLKTHIGPSVKMGHKDYFCAVGATEFGSNSGMVSRREVQVRVPVGRFMVGTCQEYTCREVNGWNM